MERAKTRLVTNQFLDNSISRFDAAEYFFLFVLVLSSTFFVLLLFSYKNKTCFKNILSFFQKIWVFFLRSKYYKNYMFSVTFFSKCQPSYLFTESKFDFVVSVVRQLKYWLYLNNIIHSYINKIYLSVFDETKNYHG